MQRRSSLTGAILLRDRKKLLMLWIWSLRETKMSEPCKISGNTCSKGRNAFLSAC